MILLMITHILILLYFIDSYPELLHIDWQATKDVIYNIIPT